MIYSLSPMFLIYLVVIVNVVTFETVWSLLFLQTSCVKLLVRSNLITSALYMIYVYTYISKTVMLYWLTLYLIQDVGIPWHLIRSEFIVLPSLSVDSKLYMYVVVYLIINSQYHRVQ